MLGDGMVEIERFKKDDKILKVFLDKYPENPRDWDNVGLMLCLHKKYDLGDRRHYLSPNDIGSWANVERHLREDLNAAVVLPLYLYDHGGISMSTRPYNDRWDSGQVGFICATEEKLKKEKLTKRKAVRILEGEVKVYNQYLMGSVYGYVLVKLKKCKACGHVEELPIDSCWGFFGDTVKESGLYENVEGFGKFREVKK